MIDPSILYPVGTERWLVWSKSHPPLRLVYRYSLKDDLEPFWYDDNDSIYAFKENATTKDIVDRCGIWPFTWWSWLPWATKLNAECKPHDFAYSCPAYQAFHLRSEADAYLEHLIEVGSGGDGSGYLAHPFEEIARTLGGSAWENSRTNN